MFDVQVTRDGGFPDAQTYRTVSLQPIFKMVPKKCWAVGTDGKRYETYKDVPFIEIMFDNGLSRIVDEVKDIPECPEKDWKNRFPLHWKAFEQGIGEAIIGTPLDMLFATSPSKVEHYKRFGVRTVEQLSDTSDGNIAGMGLGALKDRDDARTFIEEKKTGAVYEALAREKEALNAQLENVRLQAAAQAEELASLKAQMAVLVDAAQRQRAPSKKETSKDAP